MTTGQKVIKYCSIAFAVFLMISIFGGIWTAIGAVGVVLGGFGEGHVAEEMISYDIEDDYTGLEMEIGACKLTIREGDSFGVESNLEELEVTEENGTLVLKDDSKSWFSIHSTMVGEVVLTIPKEHVFESIDIETGAGELDVDVLSAEKLSLSLGAGEVNIGALNASKSATIDGGVGDIVIRGGQMNNLDYDMGVGELEFTGKLTGNSELSCGVGDATVTLLGEKEEYQVSVSKGVGDASIDGEKAVDNKDYGDGANRVEVSGGVGDFELTFFN